MDYFIYLNGEKRGPFDEASLRRFLHDGVLRPADLIAAGRDGELKPLADLTDPSRPDPEVVRQPAPPVAPESANALPSMPPVAHEALGPYSHSTLGPNETAYLRTSLHWIIFARFAVLGLVLFIFVALPFAVVVQALTGSEMGWFALPLPVLVLIPPAVAYAGSELVVTNMRVLIKTGVIRRQTLEMFVSKVESIAVDQGFLGRLFDYGTVLIRGTGGFEEPFEAIARPLEFRNCVQRLQTAQHSGATA